MKLADMMAEINETPMTQGGVYLLPGNYKLQVMEMKNGTAQSQGWDFFVAQVKVIESDNPDRQPGAICEWMVAFKNPQYKKTYLANVKNFLWAVFNGFDTSVEPDHVTDKVWALAVSEKQPLRDKYVAATAVDKPKKYTPTETFTRVTFQPWAGPEAVEDLPFDGASPAA